MSRVIASILIAGLMEPDVQPSYKLAAAGFFDHWTLATWVVTISFTSKSLITLYLLKSLVPSLLVKCDPYGPGWHSEERWRGLGSDRDLLGVAWATKSGLRRDIHNI